MSSDHDARLAVDALRELYGEPFLHSVAGPAGVVHVTALWRASASELRTMRINADTPKSASDGLALFAARARADAIVLTGKLLRDEPGLVYELLDLGDMGRSLAAWRRDVLGKPEPPYLLILTSGQDLPRSAPVESWHPALRSWPRPIIYTTREVADSVAHSAGQRVEIVGAQEPDIRAAIAYLRTQLDCGTVVIEAGPSTTNSLYDDPVAVDELLLSVYRSDDLPTTVRGGLSVSPARLGEIFGRAEMERAMQPAMAGTWSFWRLVRARAQT